MPTPEEQEDILLSCRYGELEEVRRYTNTFGPASLNEVNDDNGNTVLHMACGNGHEDVLDYLLTVVSPTMLSTTNRGGSTALHWAALNSHLHVVKKLVLFPRGPGAALIDIKNAAGRSPLGEAELTGWEEGARWLVTQMTMDDRVEESAQEEDIAEGDLEPETGGIGEEIQDIGADVSKMKLDQQQGQGATGSSRSPESE